MTEDLLAAKARQIVIAHLTDAGEVLAGRKAWTPVQVELFGILLDKVLPDASETRSEPEE